MPRSPSDEDVIEMVSSLLTVKDVVRPEPVIRIAVAEREIEAPFVRLTRMLDGTDVVCSVERSGAGMMILAHRVEPRSPSDEDVIEMVSSLFTVKDVVRSEPVIRIMRSFPHTTPSTVKDVVRSEPVIRITVAEREIEAPFVRLTRMLDGTDVVYSVERSGADMLIFVHRVAPRSPSDEDVIEMVSSLLTVKDVVRPEPVIRIAVAEREIEAPFVRLTRMLDGTDVVCSVERSGAGMMIFAHRVEPRSQGFFFTSPWVPRALFAVVLSFVMFDGYVRTAQANELIYIGDPLSSAATYTLALLGILGTHELGHLAASWHHRLRTTWPYFIPGLPVIGIPTFGAFIQSRGVTVNRRILFDVAIAGPVAGLAVTVAVVVVAASTAPVITVEEAAALNLSEWSLGEPLLMYAAIAAFGGVDEGMTILLTPMLFAAWIGFFITFLNMLPAWQLDGGHMARVLLGRKWHRYATYGSVALLAALNQWPMAILIIVLSHRNPGAEPLDDVTPLPAGRKAAFAAMAALAFLCAPLPPAQLDAVLAAFGA